MKMKKLCGKGRGSGSGSGSVHPLGEEHLLSLLPVAILSLVAALSAEDREVLAYLISNSGDPNRLLNKSKSKRQLYHHHHHHHPPLFNCHCFSCYTTYWVRWDSSPNRQLIHQIIDAFEDMTTTALEMKTKKNHNYKSITPAGNKDRRKRSGKPSSSSSIHSAIPTPLLTHFDSTSKHLLAGCSDSESLDEPAAAGEDAEVKGSVDRLMTFIALKFFGVWG